MSALVIIIVSIVIIAAAVGLYFILHKGSVSASNVPPAPPGTAPEDTMVINAYAHTCEQLDDPTATSKSCTLFTTKTTNASFRLVKNGKMVSMSYNPIVFTASNPPPEQSVPLVIVFSQTAANPTEDTPGSLVSNGFSPNSTTSFPITGKVSGDFGSQDITGSLVVGPIGQIGIIDLKAGEQGPQMTAPSFITFTFNANSVSWQIA